MFAAAAIQPSSTFNLAFTGGPRFGEEPSSLLRMLRLTMAAAGHDLRQPLQILLGAVERLGRLADDDTDRLWLDAARNQVARLSEGLEGLTEAARRPRGDRAGPKREPVRIGDVLATIAQDFRPAAMARGLKLRFVDCSTVVETDPELLKAVLRNLVGNAVKYTRQGGVVIGCRLRPDGLRIDVVDSGPGIEASDCARMFDAYRQVDAAADGLGLGLYLVQENCTALDHKLDYHSEVGSGSRFSIGIRR